MKIFNHGYDKHFNNYLQAYKETKPDLFFCNYIANEACFDLALKLKKPVVGYASSTFPTRLDPVIGCHVNMEKESFYNRFICAIVQPLRLHWMFRDYLNHINPRRAEVGVSKSNDFRERANILFLTNSFYGFESALELINRNILDGVILSTVKFNESELPSTINLSTGEVIPTSNLLNNLHPHVYIMKYAPQFAILSHENTKVFLSHGGVSSCHESIYTATPMLVLPIAFDQAGNAERLELAGMALKLSKFDLKIDDIISKVVKLLSEESFKRNAKRLQVLAKYNSKRKYRGADLIEMMLNMAKYDGIRNENDELEVNIESLLRCWITPDSRMGFFRRNYLDVFGAAMIIALALISGFYKVIMFAYRKWVLRSRNSQNFPRTKNE
ncbi:Glycosyltransferase Family 1 protein [Gigaspora rosea]|uniref:Glycosyltransferase Family 1 protein n=1 Tax=Gigaspora rosea TaxID=44941 RepID=A0A397VV46_9GLOM|nr:Glycosyltransferase Family 1 protein [Gigaspora rosea]